MCVIGEPAPESVKILGNGEYVVGGKSVKREFGNRCVFIDSRSISSLCNGVEKVAAYAKERPECTYYVTKVGVRQGDNRQEDIALLFSELLFVGNVRLPEDYIRSIVRKVHDDNAFADRFDQPQRRALKEKWIEYRKSEIERDHPDLFLIFNEGELRNYTSELISLIADAEAGVYDRGEDLNSIRVVLECIFCRMMEMGFLARNLAGNDSDCGKAVKENDRIPKHVRDCIFTAMGVVNSGSHCWLKKGGGREDSAFVQYRELVSSGKSHFLLRALIYMTLTALEWCSSEYGKHLAAQH